MKKLQKIAAMVIAMALVVTGLIVTDTTTVQAAVKLNKTSASIYVGDSVQLKLSGAKSVTWTSSNKKIATVTSKGKVKGVKKGSCTITAKDKSTKKTYKCKVTVKALKTFGLKESDVWVYTGGTVIAYQGKAIEGATYILDGNKLNASDYEIWGDADEDGEYTTLVLNKQLSEGKHTFSIQKKGYKTLAVTINFEPIKVEGMFAWEPWAENGTLYLCCNPELDGKTYTITVDGAEVQPSFDMGINGDGVYVIWVDVTGMSAGSHTVTMTADGIADGTATFTIE